MNASDAAPARFAKADPFRRHGYKFVTEHPMAEHSQPERRCVVCNAKLASDNLDVQCTCHTQGHIEFSDIVTALAELADEDRIGPLAALYGAEQPDARKRHAEWWRLNVKEGIGQKVIARMYHVAQSTVIDGINAHIEDSGGKRPRTYKENVYARNQKFLRLYKEGYSQPAIAEEMSVSLNTVKNGIYQARNGKYRAQEKYEARRAS